jgi:hypothetical protein
MTKQVRDHLQIERCSKHHQHPSAQCCHTRLHYGEQQKSNSQYGDEIIILRHQCLIDNPLHIEGREDGKKL